jgi:integration host factor subunit beta
MVKSEIIDKLVERLASQAYNITKREIRETAKTTVDAIFNAISVALSNGQRIEVRGFGSFSLKKRAAGLVRNPRYNRSLESGERHNVYFRAGKDLADRVDKINQPAVAKPVKQPKVKTKLSKVA